LRTRLADWSRDQRTIDKTAPEVAGLEGRFRSAIADDLDLPAVMALVAKLNHSPVAPGAKAALLREWDRVLGLDLERPTPHLGLPSGAGELLDARMRARAAKDFVASDRLRAELAAIGVVVTDTPQGQSWKVG
jgi:cysteinyl-tRNA synthetase